MQPGRVRNVLKGGRLKIAYVITRSDVLGGASIHLLDLAAGMQAKGHDVVIGVGADAEYGVLFERAKAMGLKCHGLRNLVREISPIKDLLCFFELRKFFKSIRPDIVHVHSSKAGVVGRLAARSLSLPVVFTAHGWAFTEGVSVKRQKLYRWIESQLSKISNKIITVSEYDRQLAISQNVAGGHTLITVHNGVPEIMPVDVQRSPSDTVKIIMVARFEKPKNQAAVLHALAHSEAQNWQLELVGDGPELAKCVSLAEQLNIDSKVTFSGACFDVAERLATSDIFVLISDWEGLPLTILEAMRSGLPVIASDVGGVAESIDNHTTGILIPRNYQLPLGKALVQLVNSQEERNSMGYKAREKFDREFTFDIMLRKTLCVYQTVLDQRI